MIPQAIGRGLAKAWEVQVDVVGVSTQVEVARDELAAISLPTCYGLLYIAKATQIFASQLGLKRRFTSVRCAKGNGMSLDHYLGSIGGQGPAPRKGAEPRLHPSDAFTKRPDRSRTDPGPDRGFQRQPTALTAELAHVPLVYCS